MIAALRAGAQLSLGIDHSCYTHAVAQVATATRQALLEDFNG
jgi:hypothetical protein